MLYFIIKFLIAVVLSLIIYLPELIFNLNFFVFE